MPIYHFSSSFYCVILLYLLSFECFVLYKGRTDRGSVLSIYPFYALFSSSFFWVFSNLASSPSFFLVFFFSSCFLLAVFFNLVHEKDRQEFSSFNIPFCSYSLSFLIISYIFLTQAFPVCASFRRQRGSINMVPYNISFSILVYI